jgi:hypothetical protein
MVACVAGSGEADGSFRGWDGVSSKSGSGEGLSVGQSLGEGSASGGKEDDTPEMDHPRRDTDQFPGMKIAGGVD